MKHFIFDFDGTLVDTDGLFSSCLSHALEPFSIEVGPFFMEEIRHKHPHRIFEDILDPDSAARALKRMQEIGKDLSQRIQSFDGIEETLKLLHNKGIRLSIWTGRDGESTRRILKNIGLQDCFELVMSGTCVETNKPGLDGLQQIARHFKVDHPDMVMIGDHHHDIVPANDFGCFSIHAQWKETPHVLPEGVKPNIGFQKVDHFRRWIDSSIK